MVIVIKTMKINKEENNIKIDMKVIENGKER